MLRQHLPFALGVLLCAACEPMESRGSIFSAAPAPVAAIAPADPGFAFPTEPPLTLTSEQLAGGDAPAALLEATGTDPDAVEPDATPVAVSAAPVAAPTPVAPPSVGLPAVTAWPVRLVSTLPQAQPPRAILGLPNGEERVVSPGSILAEQGLVVMAVTGDRVQLAQIEPAGDHAKITTLELTSQYPAGR